MSHKKFVTAINCMDGRTQEPLINWAKEKFGADYIDMINEPGPDKVLLTDDKNFFNYTLKKIKISTEKHGSKLLIIVGHYDCAGNPVSKEEHINFVKESIKTVKTLLSGIDIIGIYINENWEVEELEI